MTAHIRAFPLASVCNRMSPKPGLWQRLRAALARRAAGIGAGSFSMHLGAAQQLRLHDAAGWTVVCRSGSVWITQESDARDVFLNAGEGFALDRDGLALVGARRDAVVSIRLPVGGGSLVSANLLEPRGTEQSWLRTDESPRLAWLKALYPDSGPWNDPAGYRRFRPPRPRADQRRGRNEGRMAG